MMRKIMKQQRKLLFILLLSFGFGGVLAKIAPLKSSGLSIAFKQEQPKVAEKKNKATTETTSQSQAKPAVALSYTEQVNQAIDAGQFTGHLPIHLQLQTDNKWKDAAYGVGNSDGNTLGINGCALASLAMVASYLDQRKVSPLDVLHWAGNNYYLEGQGTAWSIFAAYSEAKGYVCQELGANLTTVEAELKANHPVIVSVKPGYFTKTGHIMVMSGTENGNFWINDPNDTAEKSHSKRTYTAAEILNEAVNFWTVYKEA
ncbi:peptidase C39 family protein [Enterococcus faecalis]